MTIALYFHNLFLLFLFAMTMIGALIIGAAPCWIAFLVDANLKSKNYTHFERERIQERIIGYGYGIYALTIILLIPLIMKP